MVTLYVMYIILYVYTMLMKFVSKKSNLSKEMTLGGNQLNCAITYKYFGHVIFNNLSDIPAKVRHVYCTSEMQLMSWSFYY